MDDKPRVRRSARTFLACALMLGAVGSAVGVDRLTRIPLGLTMPYIPTENPMSAEKVTLGEMLFFDRRLSADGRLSCGTCHDPARAFTDGQRLSVAVHGKRSRRNTPTVLNAAFFDLQNWDGKALSLELQALGALTNPDEMGMSNAAIVAVLSSSSMYRELFRQAFGRISVEAAVMAIAAYERNLLSGNSSFDWYLYGGNETAISDAAKRGFDVFVGKGECLVCHTIMHKRLHPFGGRTALFTDNRFHNIGVGMNPPILDRGRFEVTGQEEDLGRFKTPTLRNVQLTAPYMHDGSLSSLEDVVDFYDKGGIANPNLDPGIKRLHLTKEEKRDLVEFLQSLTDERYQARFDGGS